MLEIFVVRAIDEGTEQTRVHCAVCETEFRLGVVYAWMMVEGSGPGELCERCLRGLTEWASSEGLHVAWKDAHAVYMDARQRYTKPISTHAEMLSMSLEEHDRIFEEAYLT